MADEAHSEIMADPVSISARLGQLQFHRSGKFRVLQVADIQEGAKVSKDTVKLIAAACDFARPDVVIFTGNQIAGYDSAFAATYRARRWPTMRDAVYAPADSLSVASFGGEEPSEDALEHTRELVKKQARQFLQPLIDRRIPFAITYGNHDFQCGLDASELDAIYRAIPGCLNPPALPDTDSGSPTQLDSRAQSAGMGAVTELPLAEATAVWHSGLRNQRAYPCEAGTFALPVLDCARTHVIAALMLVNSGDYARGGGYGAPTERALDWMRRIPQHIGAKSLVFQHFPVRQMYQLLTEVPPASAYAIRGYRAFDGKSYVLDPAKTKPGSFLGEGISCPDEPTGEMDAMLSSGGYIGLCTGHDHRNGFVGTLNGLMFAATPTSGFGSYGPAAERRAVRYIEFDDRHPDHPRTQLLDFGAIVGKASSRSVHTFEMSHVPAKLDDFDEKRPLPKVFLSPSGLGKSDVELTAGEGQKTSRQGFITELLATLTEIAADANRRK